MGKTIVVSATNLFEGGPLNIGVQCATALAARPDTHTIFLVYRKDLYPPFPSIEYIELPRSRRSWLYRLYYEFYGIRRLLRKRTIDTFLSLQDFSTYIKAGKKAVYCHNPSPFYKATATDRKYAFNFYLFTLFYGYLYGLNIHSNDFVVVQQQWIREAFCMRYHLNPSKVVVAYPEITQGARCGRLPAEASAVLEPGIYTFFYPSLARTHKNFEDVISAARMVESRTDTAFQIVLTIDSSMGPYAIALIEQAKGLKSIRFIGKQSYESVCALYDICNCVLFPSKLETWGLPISEAKLFNKPLIAADLQYAHETLQEYGKAAFFTPGDSKALATLMIEAVNDKLSYRPADLKTPEQPFALNWEALLDLIV